MKKGKKMTIFSLNTIGFTCKTEITLLEMINPKGQVTLAFKQKGKRKTYLYKPKKDWLIFGGWNIPLKTELELTSGCTFANANFRLGGVDDVLEWVMENNINDEFSAFNKIDDIAKKPMPNTQTSSRFTTRVL